MSSNGRHRDQIYDSPGVKGKQLLGIVSKGKLGDLKELLKQRGDLVNYILTDRRKKSYTIPFQAQTSPIDVAAEQKNLAIVRFLVAQGASLRSIGPTGFTPVQLMLQEAGRSEGQSGLVGHIYAFSLLKIAVQYQPAAVEDVLRCIEQYPKEMQIDILFMQKGLNGQTAIECALRSYLFSRRVGKYAENNLPYTEGCIQLASLVQSGLLSDKQERLAIDVSIRLLEAVKRLVLTHDFSAADIKGLKNYLLNIIVEKRCQSENLEKHIVKITKSLGITGESIALCCSGDLYWIKDKVTAAEIYRLIKKLPVLTLGRGSQKLLLASEKPALKLKVKAIIRRMENDLPLRDALAILAFSVEGVRLMEATTINNHFSDVFIFKVLQYATDRSRKQLVNSIAPILKKRGGDQFAVLADRVIDIDDAIHNVSDEEKEDLINLRAKVFDMLNHQFIELEIAPSDDKRLNPARSLRNLLETLEEKYQLGWLFADEKSVLERLVVEIRSDRSIQLSSPSPMNRRRSMFGGTERRASTFYDVRRQSMMF